jgi:hypothetical protein
MKEMISSSSAEGEKSASINFKAFAVLELLTNKVR